MPTQLISLFAGIALAAVLLGPAAILVGSLSHRLLTGRRRNRPMMVGGAIGGLAVLSHNLALMPQVLSADNPFALLGSTPVLLGLALAWLAFWARTMILTMNRWGRRAY